MPPFFLNYLPDTSAAKQNALGLTRADPPPRTASSFDFSRADARSTYRFELIADIAEAVHAARSAGVKVETLSIETLAEFGAWLAENG